MDERIQRAIDEFTKRVKQVYPDATTEVQDYKWSTEDAYIDVGIPPMADEEEEDKIQEVISDLRSDLFEETGVYIIALARTSDKAEV